MIRPVVFSAPKSKSNLDILSHYSFENLCRGNFSLKTKIKAFMHTQTCQNVALPSVVTRKFDCFHPKSFTIAEFISNEVKSENKEFKWKKCSDFRLCLHLRRHVNHICLPRRHGVERYFLSLKSRGLFYLSEDCKLFAACISISRMIK